MGLGMLAFNASQCPGIARSSAVARRSLIATASRMFVRFCRPSSYAAIDNSLRAAELAEWKESTTR